MLGKGLRLLRANGGRFKINPLLFEDYAVLVADLENLCRVMSELDRVVRKKIVASECK